MNKTNLAKRRWCLFALVILLTGCGEDGGSGSSGGADGLVTGTGGSTARMTIVGDYLYAISGNSLQLFDVSVPSSPNPWTQVRVDWDIQTIFPYGDYLLVGAADGVHILDNSDRAAPMYLTDFTHATTQDPVVAQNGYAYVTLKSDFTRPNGFIEDQMNVLDINDITDPQLIFDLPMQEPEGLAVIGNQLFICDGVAGLKEFDVSNPAEPRVASVLADVNCNDVIARNGILYVITDFSLQQYDYSVSPPAILSRLNSVNKG